MKKFILSAVLLLSALAYSQTGNVGINTATPAATLDVTGTPATATVLDGIIAPRINGTQLSAKTYTPAQTGALVYATAAAAAADITANSQVTNVTAAGYYYFDGTLWQTMAGSSGTTSSGWALLGNAATDPAANFLGTTDDKDLKFRVNNNQVGWFTTDAATNANSIFLGNGAGVDNNASNSNFFGQKAGSDATDANNSNFIGQKAGISATSAENSNFIGQNAGNNATNANNSNFIGTNAGGTATNAFGANFIGQGAGNNAAKAANSVFIGKYAGNGAANAANSIFIGQQAGGGDVVDNSAVLQLGNTPTTSILIGQLTSTGGFKNSMAIGSHATNTASNQLMIGDPDWANTGNKYYGAVQYDMVNPKYPQTRDDSGTTSPVNFLYTDVNGMFLSAPVTEPWQVETTTNLATTNAQNIYQMGNVGIATTAPNSTLQVAGSFSTPFRTVTGDTDITDKDHTVALTVQGPATFTLPNPTTCSGRIYRFINYVGNGDGGTSDGGTPLGSNEINFSIGVYYYNGVGMVLGNAIWSIANNFIAQGSTGFSTSLTIQSDGTNWYAVGL